MGYIRHNAIIAITWRTDAADSLVEYDASIALRCILDGDMELGARTALKESSK